MRGMDADLSYINNYLSINNEIERRRRGNEEIY